MDSRAEPTSFSISEDGTVHVEVHLTARDLKGNLLFDTRGRHVFQIENGLIIFPGVAADLVFWWRPGGDPRVLGRCALQRLHLRMAVREASMPVANLTKRTVDAAPPRCRATRFSTPS
jgi:hypothetical protein